MTRPMLSMLLVGILAIAIPSSVSAATPATTIDVDPGADNHVQYETETTAGGSRWMLDQNVLVVKSEIPVSVLRYNDQSYLEGEQPVKSGDVYVVVKSNCSRMSSEADFEFTPTVTFGVDQQNRTNSISISVDPPSSSSKELDTTSFLEPSSFFAKFSYTSFWCKSNQYYNNEDFNNEEPEDSTVTAPVEGDVLVGIFNGNLLSSSASKMFRPFQLTVTVVAITLMGFFAMVPTSDGHGKHGVSFLTIAIAVLAVMTVLVHVQASNDGKELLQAQNHHNTRELASSTCTMNVEIMFDGCVRAVQVIAPAVRTLDVVLTDQTYADNPDDECTTDLTANLTFQVPRDPELATEELDDSSTASVSPFPDNVCIRAIEGRPFVDKSGRQIQASANISSRSDINDQEVCWSVGASVALSETEIAAPMADAATQKLGSEWTTRALGEHASVSSFAAFVIALMSNNAPPALIKDALLAALDEVQHATTSFEVASLLLQATVEPGPLPPSAHTFGNNMTALALAAAREGCIDETLSALVAAYDVDENADKEVDKFNGIHEHTLVLVKDKLRTIALDEARHSSLAWRTVHWACSVDKDACATVQQEVFAASNLDLAFERRISGNNTSQSMVELQTGWERICKTLVPFVTTKAVLPAVQGARDECLKLDGDASGSEQTGKYLTEMLVDNIIRGVVCSPDDSDHVDRVHVAKV